MQQRLKPATLVIALLWIAAPTRAQDGGPVRTLAVHIVQASGQSNYAFVRANFRPGEVDDPWTVRFFDPRGNEVPYHVWDAVDWQTAREGRADWGKQYPLLQHYPGNDPAVKKARAEKLAWAKRFMPAEAAEMEAIEQAAGKWPRSPCVVLYLLRYRAAPYAKDRLTMKVYAKRQVVPHLLEFTNKEANVSVGDLAIKGFPRQPEVLWKGKPLFRYAGFKAGQTESKHPHVQGDYSWTLERGIVTKLRVRSKTEGRMGGGMNWDCTYWLLPEGAYVALEGYSLEQTAGYLGGPQQMSILEAATRVEQLTGPTWPRPWHVEKIGGAGFAALHLFTNAPLSVGYDNNPFIVGADRHKAPDIEVDDTRLALSWDYQFADRGVFRMLAPDLLRALPAKANHAPPFLMKAMRSGKVGDLPRDMYSKSREHLEEQLKLLRWQPNIDWLYRQYAVGVHEVRDKAEQAVAHAVCAAGGWIDRPCEEERLARLIVDVVREWGQVAVAEDNCNVPTWTVHLLVGEITHRPAVVRAALRFAHPESLAKGKAMLERVKAAGIDPRIQKTNECMFGNPGYHSSENPRLELLLGYFGHDKTLPEFRAGLLEWADYILPILAKAPAGPALEKGGLGGGDWNSYREAYMNFWPSRTVLVLPTFLYAHRLTKKDIYKSATVRMMDDLIKQQNANPLGHWNAWSFQPKTGGRDYDTVYIGATVDRGIWDFYTQKQLKMVGEKRMSNLVAGLCRSTLVGHKFADNGETDNFACEASYHGGHPQTRQHAFLMLQDDFDFYRGLVGDMIRWGAMAPERTDGVAYRWLTHNRPFIGGGPGSPIVLPLMWALGIYAGERPQQARILPVSRGDKPLTKGSWRAAIKNALPGDFASLTVTLGSLEPELIKSNRPLSAQALWRVTVLEPTYRAHAKVEVDSSATEEIIRVSHRTQVFFAYPRTHADWSDARRLAVTRDGSPTPVDVTLRDGGLVFTAERGTYRVSSAR
jgi:hypothetical protein